MEWVEWIFFNDSFYWRVFCIKMKNCEKCGKESKLRRGLCLNCYRKETGLSGGIRKNNLNSLIKELERAEQRVKIVKLKLKHRLNL